MCPWMENKYNYFHHSRLCIFLIPGLYCCIIFSLFMKLKTIFGLKHYVKVAVFHYICIKEFCIIKWIFLLLLVLRCPLYLRTKNAGSKKCIERSQKGRSSFSWGCGQKENKVFHRKQLTARQHVPYNKTFEWYDGFPVLDNKTNTFAYVEREPLDPWWEGRGNLFHALST